MWAGEFCSSNKEPDPEEIRFGAPPGKGSGILGTGSCNQDPVLEKPCGELGKASWQSEVQV